MTWIVLENRKTQCLKNPWKSWSFISWERDVNDFKSLFFKLFIPPPVLQHHLKKLEGRRLDYDYKKKRLGKIPDEEVKQALEKFHESKEVAEISMYNLLETDVSKPERLWHPGPDDHPYVALEAFPVRPAWEIKRFRSYLRLSQSADAGDSFYKNTLRAAVLETSSTPSD